MDYELYKRKLKTAILYFAAILFFAGCNGNDKNKTEQNTYYVEVVNCNDSLKHSLLSDITGKTSYMKNNKMEIFSLNYLTEYYPDMHYYKEAPENNNNIKEGEKKIRVEFSGNLTVDSTFYSIQRFKFSEKQWIKISDMGFIRASSTRIGAKKTDKFGYLELIRLVIYNVAASTH